MFRSMMLKGMILGNFKFAGLGRAALVAATGLCLCIAGPSHAVEGDSASGEKAQAESAGAPVVLKKFTKRSKYARRASPRKSARADKVAAAKRTKVDAAAKAEIKPADADTAAASQAPSSPATTADASAATIPASIANANAQWVSSPTTAADAAARGMSNQADSVLRAAQANQPAPSPVSSPDSSVVDSGQINEVDRTMAESPAAPAPAATLTMAASSTTSGQDGQTGNPGTPTAAVVANDDSTWGQASFIGKIFIAFGGLLTLASAARMFMG